MDLVPLDQGAGPITERPYQVSYVKKEVSSGGESCHVIEIRWRPPVDGPDKQWMWLGESDLLERKVEAYSGNEISTLVEFWEWKDYPKEKDSSQKSWLALHRRFRSPSLSESDETEFSAFEFKSETVNTEDEIGAWVFTPQHMLRTDGWM